MVKIKYLFLHYPKCTTSKRAKKWLDENNISYDERNIKENNPNVEELKKWIDNSNFSIKKFFNTSGIIYREKNLKDKLDTMTDDEKIKLLATDGMLVKRPLIICEDFVLVGFKENEWSDKLKS